MHSGPALVNKWLCDLGWGILLSVNPALICPPPLSYPPRILKNLSEVGPLLLATLVSLALQQYSWVQLDVSISGASRNLGNSSPAGPHPLLRTSRAVWAERKPDRDRTPRRQSQPCVCQEPPGAGAHAAGG
ncbi:uncharacterized protein ACOB7L_016836 isoform 1-T1 [Callospermophilus lateralis]|uniref:uncharacterized protein LOC143401407 isoform X1 n=1 Tax=Callospermophilus lateralis TaxID=76772 RepID=UPI0040385371